MLFMGLSLQIVTAFILLNIVSADFQLTIVLKSLTLNGYLQNGDPCSPFNGLGVQCFPRPKICVEPLEYATDNLDQCVIGSYIDLGVGNNTNELTFSPNAYYGGWYNPSTFDFFGDFLGFSVKMIIWNADGTNYQEIDRVQWNITEDSPTTADESDTPRIISFKFDWDVKVQTQPTGAPTSATSPVTGGSTGSPSSPPDCSNIFVAGPATITIGGSPVSVYCDGIGGTAIQRRIDGSGDFDSMDIATYKGMIGTADKSYWLGLDSIHTLTSGATEYKAVITTCCKTTPSVENYDSFKVGDSASNYPLTVTASAGRLMTTGLNTQKTDNGSPFSTYSNFNLDIPDKTVCASARGAGGWWFGSCDNNLNGHYYESSELSDANTCAFDAASHYDDTGAGISYPVGISYQKTQIVLYQKSSFRNIDFNAAAQDFCTST